MNADSIKNALTRKIGPLPAWAWFLIGGAALWYYRQRTAANSSDASQAAAADSTNTPAYYGPYGQDNYPITGGGGTGGGDGGSTMPTGSTDATNPPTINVNVPGGGGKSERRKPKIKAQHRQKVHKPKNTGELRSDATTHNGRKSKHASGPTRSFHGGPVRLRKASAPAYTPPKRTRKRR